MDLNASLKKSVTHKRDAVFEYHGRDVYTDSRHIADPQVDHIFEVQIGAYATAAALGCSRAAAGAITTPLKEIFNPADESMYNVTTRSLNDHKGKMVTSFLQDRMHSGGLLVDITYIPERYLPAITRAMLGAETKIVEALYDFRPEGRVTGAFQRVGDTVNDIFKAMQIDDVFDTQAARRRAGAAARK